MSQKIIFLDIDGTLTVPASGQVTPKVKSAIKAAQDNGHYVFICTGRNRAGIRSLMELGFDGAICSAGGYIEVNGKQIFESFLSDEELKKVRNILDSYDISYNMEATHITFQSDEMSEEFFKHHLPADKVNSELGRMLQAQKNQFNIHSFDEYDQQPLPIHKICFITHDQDALNKVMKRLSDQYHFVIHDVFSQTIINGEMMKNGNDKGVAVNRVCEYLGIDKADTIGFGDSMNDYEMIKTCAYGVVMANGSQELKQYADTICESVQEDGIYHEFKRLGLME